MTKYIQKQREYKPITHKLINDIMHKRCLICKESKPLEQFHKNAKARDGKYSYCKSCANVNLKQRNNVALEKRKNTRNTAPTGFSVCLFVGCGVKKWLQPVNQFIGAHVRNDKPTMHCLTCRDIQKKDRERRYAPCQKVWDDFRKKHPCSVCIKDPNYKHNYLVIEADHLGGKVKDCSNVSYWSHSKRGPDALRKELKKCQPLCGFCHALVTQQRRNKTELAWVLRKRVIINEEKHKRGCCFVCKRPVKIGEECAFDFDHRDPLTKFKYKGKTKGPSQFVNLPYALFYKQWPLEQAKCDLLCTNCHMLKSRANKDGYKN